MVRLPHAQANGGQDSGADQGSARGTGPVLQVFWAANTIVAQAADRGLVQSLAARPDVKVIESNTPSNWLEADQSAIAEGSFDSVSMIKASAPEVIEPGVNQVKAPNVWALGFNGTGIVVAVQDTGNRWTHNALKPKYRGWNGSAADHNYNWWDAIHSGGGICTPNHQEPCDDFFHGTHVREPPSVTTESRPEPDRRRTRSQVDRLPEHGQGNGTPATYTECFQFFMAPTNLQGQNPDPTRRPHVMNNSWGCPPSEGCAANTLQQVSRTRRPPASSWRSRRGTPDRAAPASTIRPRSTPRRTRRAR